MILPFIFSSSAEADLQDAYQWYEERKIGLGGEFLSCVEGCLASIQHNPHQFAIIHKHVRRALIRRFPYTIFYVVDSAHIHIIAVFHGHRDPKQWTGRA